MVLVLAACSHHAATPEVREQGDIETLGQPVSVSRIWSTALAPNRRGGWNLILQTYEYQSDVAVEFVVLDLETGRFTIDDGPVGAYANSNYQIAEQLRASNGRIFFAELDNRLAYYDPADEHVHQLPPILDAKGGDKMLFRLVFGPDGKLYAGTQSNGLPTIVSIDPGTLRVRVLGKVGEHRLSYSYAYYLAVDLPWIYVAVGEDPWELVALDTNSGKSTVLATRDGNGFMQLDSRAEGVVATLIAALRTSSQQVERVALVDGVLRPQQPASGHARERSLAPKSSPLRDAPELDLAHAVPDSRGFGHVRWRLRGGQWSDATFQVKHTSPIAIDSLTALPDGSVLGSVRQYHGFFRYSPTTSKLEALGEFKLSGGPRLVIGDHVYFSGYPNAPLWMFDASRAWDVANPKLLGAFSAAGTHYAYFLRSADNRHVFYAGRRERDGFGTGIGSYDIATGEFMGLHDGLDAIDPRGLELYGDRLVLSGEVRRGLTEKDAALFVFDPQLHQLDRLEVRPGLRNTGELFHSEARDVALGVVHGTNGISVYRYDLANKRLLAWRDVASKDGPVTSDPQDHSLWMMSERSLIKLDPITLQTTYEKRLPENANADDVLLRVGDRIYWGAGSELRSIRISY